MPKGETSLKLLGACETQAVTVEGLRSILATDGRMGLAWSADNLFVVRQLLRQQPVDILMVDKGFGLQAVVHLLNLAQQLSRPPVALVWGTSITEAEALRLLREGVRGVLRKNSSIETVLRCLDAVQDGRSWIEDFGPLRQTSSGVPGHHPSDLTPREQQVLELVEQGLRNREIAAELGIKPGTVKIHMKHIFEKTGVHGRYGLAIQGLRQRALEGAGEMQALAGRAG